MVFFYLRQETTGRRGELDESLESDDYSPLFVAQETLLMDD